MAFDLVPLCIQESWLSKNYDISLFHLSNYYCISDSQGKTIIIYLNKKFKYNIKNIHTKTDSWECQFIEITGQLPSKNIILGNVYRPPKNTNIDNKKLIDKFTIILALFENCNSELIIAGDYNIDLLKVNEKDVIGDFFNILTTHSVYPKITLPTRFSNQNGTLINNFFCRLSSPTLNSISGILF